MWAGKVEEKMKLFAIDSKIGAFGAFFVLQAYGLLLFYEFANGLSIVRSCQETDHYELFQFVCFVMFFSGYGFVQSKLLMAVETFLKSECSLDSVLDELRSGLGVIRGVLGILFLALVLVFWFRPDLLGFAPVKTPVLIAYQVGYPVITYIGGKMMFGSPRKTKTKTVYISRSALIGGISSLIAPGIMAWLADILFIKNQDAMHIFGTAGLGMAIFGVTLFMVTSLEGKDWELPAE
jgi:hypothetical protein